MQTYHLIYTHNPKAMAFGLNELVAQATFFSEDSVHSFLAFWQDHFASWIIVVEE